jgi:hypothetical protein
MMGGRDSFRNVGFQLHIYAADRPRVVTEIVAIFTPFEQRGQIKSFILMFLSMRQDYVSELQPLVGLLFIP